MTPPREIAWPCLPHFAWSACRAHRPRAVILLGDFCQLPPTRPAMTLAEALVMASRPGARQAIGATDQGKIQMKAAAIFRKFTRFKFTFADQMRCTDPEHSALLRRFDLALSERPITKTVLRRLQMLTSEVLRNDPELEDAGVAVQSNQ